MRDGTFGTTADCVPMEDDLVHGVENHHFEPLEQLYWRNSELDFTGLESLLASLQTGPPRNQGLSRGPDAVDLETLETLSRDPEVRALAYGRKRVRLLWETCGIPDFRKLTDDTHTKLCARVFQHLVRDGVLPEAWLEAGIGSLARADGDIDTLMARLSGVRVWAYIAARSDWVPDAQGWQARTRQVEDLLSDSLHEKLTARFVDRRAAHLMRRMEEGGAELLSAVTLRGEVVVEGHPVGHVSGFVFLPDPAAEGPERRVVLRAARRALREWMPRRVEAIEAAADSELGWGADHRLSWAGVDIARMRPGPGLLRPAIDVFDSEFLDGPRRERVRLRLLRFVMGHVEQALAPLFAAEANATNDPALRGVLHRLIEAGGVLPGATEADIVPAVRAALKTARRQGRAVRAVHAGIAEAAGGSGAGRIAGACGRASSRRGCRCRAGCRSGRRSGRWAWRPPWGGSRRDRRSSGSTSPSGSRPNWPGRPRMRPAAVPDSVASRLSVSRDAVPAVLRALGFRLFPAAALPADAYGPPAPVMLQPRRPVRPVSPAPVAPPRPDNPFAALGRVAPLGGPRGSRVAAARQMAVVRPVHEGAIRLRTPGRGRARCGSIGSRRTSRMRGCAWAT